MGVLTVHEVKGEAYTCLKSRGSGLTKLTVGDRVI